MTNKPIIAKKETTLIDAAKLMEESNVNSLLVVEKDSAVGLVTDEDIVRKVITKGLDPKKLLLKDIMTTNLISISPGKDVYDALVLMKDNNIRQLPVQEGSKLVGFLSLKDILKIQPVLIDLLVENYELREEEQKRAYQKDFFPELKNKKAKKFN